MKQSSLLEDTPPSPERRLPPDAPQATRSDGTAAARVLPEHDRETPSGGVYDVLAAYIGGR